MELQMNTKVQPQMHTNEHKWFLFVFVCVHLWLKVLCPFAVLFVPIRG